MRICRAEINVILLQFALGVSSFSVPSPSSHYPKGLVALVRFAHSFCDHPFYIRMVGVFGDGKDKELLRNIARLRQDQRFQVFDDHQLEMMLMHHDVEEVLRFGPEEALERYNDLSVYDAFYGDIDI